MSVLVTISQAHKAYGGQVLLDAADLRITDGMKIAVVGRNGAGKSTLCRCILGREELDSGSIDLAPDLRIAFLEQHDDFEPGETVQAYLERRSGQPDWRCGEVAGRFDLKGPTLTGPITRLSGGWQTRVKLAAMLLRDPQLLILDEPTNFLDLRTQLLLERFLADWRGAALIVSHDRTFLGKTCTHTCEVARGELSLLAGNVETFYAKVAEERARLERENATTAARMKQLQTFVDKHRASAGTASQARNKAKQIDRLQLHELDDGPGASTRIAVPDIEVRQGPALRCIDLAIGYAGAAVAKGIDLELERGTKLAVVGDNGQGKTTFLRSLTGSLPPVGGRVEWTHGADLGVYGQHVFGTLPEDATVYAYLETAAPPDTKRQELLAMAGSFLFRDAAVDKRIAVLSGGERARLVLASMLLHRHTVLVLDEPTNHLDLETVEALAAALTRYRGTVIVVSHDRRFLASVATAVVEVAAGGARNFPGPFSEYLARLEREGVTGDRPSSGSESEPAARRPAAGRERHRLTKQLAALERRSQRLDDELAAIDAELLTTTCPDRAQTLHARQDQLRSTAAEVEAQWCKGLTLMDGLDSDPS